MGYQFEQIGLLDTHPVHITLDPSKPSPRRPQYKLLAEAVEGIGPMLKNFLEQGVIF